MSWNSENWNDNEDNDEEEMYDINTGTYNKKTKFKPPKRPKSPKKFFKLLSIAITVILILGCITSSIVVIPTGSTGIRITMGKVDNNLIKPGPTFKAPFIQDIAVVNNKQQTYTFNERVWGESSEQTVVYMEGVTVSYQINADYSVWIYSNVTDYVSNALPPTILASALKAAMVELKTTEVTNRAKVEPLATEKLQESINKKYNDQEVISIVSVNINNIDFEDNYNQAIEQRQIAQLEYEKQQTQIKTQLEKAEADKQERQIKAEADATEKKIQAEAEANAIKAVADAQAEANRKLAQSITKDLVDYEKIQKWNGELPQVTGGNAIIDMTENNSSTTAP